MASTLPNPPHDEHEVVASASGSMPGQNADWAQAILDLRPEGLIFVDRHLVIRCANVAAHEFLGKPAGSLVGKQCQEAVSLFRDLSDDEPFNIHDALSTSIERGAARAPGSTLQARDTGSRFTELDVKIMPVFRNGQTWGAAIEMAPHSRSRDGTGDELALLSLVSHELRTPLLHIKGFVSSLLEQDVKWDAENQLDFLRTVDRETDRLSAIVSQLLEISRMTTSAPLLDREEFRPQLLAFTGVDEASPFLSRHRVDVTVADDLPPVSVDRLRMTSVFVNLLENAVKYSPEKTTIEVGARVDDGFVIFYVSDQGTGIPAHMLEKVFELFARGPVPAPHSGNVRPKGSGLGLSVCRSVIEAHGGRIWVESKPGEGSTFCFAVPVAGRS